MERHEILDVMSELKLYGTRASFEEIAGKGLAKVAACRQASPSAAPIAPRGQVYSLSVSPPSLLTAISAARLSGGGAHNSTPPL